jgi:DNA repair photolyase
VAARSALNEVPAASAVPFRWTINPYRGCAHACVYCFAPGTHAWLELDTGADFDREIVVKVNVVEVLGRELGRPGIIRALARSGTPFSVLTKGTLLRRDLPLVAAAARDVPVGLAVSVGVHDEDLQGSVEPGTPTPRAPAAAAALPAPVRAGGLRPRRVPGLVAGAGRPLVGAARGRGAGATDPAVTRQSRTTTSM